MSAVTLRSVAPSDAEAICAIYNPHVRDTIVTFEDVPLTPMQMAERIVQVQGAGYPWWVAEQSGRVVGYAYAARWRSRAAYDPTVETTIYVAADAQRGGIGVPLYDALLGELAERGYHVALGCIALPNPASVAFHERCGFRKVAHHAEVGRKFGRWIDVGFWQRMLQR
ncbi:MAG: phosphinothricin acetyltransferase [Rhodanobacter denitrificans]|uniref:Phosphinothricin acetyltransferase n=1 Tax=Rhodanobacter denitrificans TaxID=666685 RepID=A0A2W5MFU1_9GAMM|nr:MAG: phosphinothricin acetyltransferase [Rhodanobacter denitrificans]